MSTGFDIAPINFNADLGNNPKAASLLGPGTQVENSGVPQISFAEALSAAGTDFVSSLQRAEATSIAGIKGEATAYEVASSVMEAEQALRMTVAIRDRMVQAYLEISRMQI